MTKQKSYILILLTIILNSCRTNSEKRIEYNFYELGQKIDSNWIILNEDRESKFKLLKNFSDSNFICKTIGDTIWYMSIENITNLKAIELRDKYNEICKTYADCTFVENVAGIWDCYKFEWIELCSQTEINLYKCNNNKNDFYGNWTLEIVNQKLMDNLNKNHDPYYYLTAPEIN